eukprot:gene7194-biopygen21019
MGLARSRGTDEPMLAWEVCGENENTRRGSGNGSNEKGEWMYALSRNVPNPWGQYRVPVVGGSARGPAAPALRRVGASRQLARERTHRLAASNQHLPLASPAHSFYRGGRGRCLPCGAGARRGYNVVRFLRPPPK